VAQLHLIKNVDDKFGNRVKGFIISIFFLNHEGRPKALQSKAAADKITAVAIMNW
jgi:hypothetical protein